MHHPAPVGSGRIDRRTDPDVARAYRLARHAATLTRLSRRIATFVARGGRDGQHLRAASTAYDQTLILAAAEFGLAGDLVAPLRPSDRLLLEAHLAMAGLRWGVTAH